MSNSSVCPDLVQNCLQSLSADEKSEGSIGELTDNSRTVTQLVACLSVAGCLGLGSGGWCGYGRYGLFRLTWMMLQIVSYID